jgi:hypothetical protein
MSEQQNQDSRELAILLEELSKEDCLRVQGVIAGIRLARNLSFFPGRSEDLKSVPRGA